MDTTMSPPPSQRPQHRRNASSKTNVLRSLVSAKSRPSPPEANNRAAVRSETMPVLPPGLSLAASPAKASRVLGERQGNVQSPPSSPFGGRTRTTASGKDEEVKKLPTKTKDGSSSPKKSKSSTNLSAMFAKMNRSSKDVSAIVRSKEKDKENTTPPSSSSGPVSATAMNVETPIWQQFASISQDEVKPRSRPSTRGSNPERSIQDEIAMYTPVEYSPSKQRNFNGTLEQPSLRPTLARSRPQSAYVLPTEGRSVSGARVSVEARRSDEVVRRQSKDQARRVSGDRATVFSRWNSSEKAERKVSGSSTEAAGPSKHLTIVKRGGRVMAAVAAFQGKNKSDDGKKEKKEAELDPKAVEEAFEAVLNSRQIPEHMRLKMRNLTMRVKQDFVKQDQGSKTNSDSPTGTPSHEAAISDAVVVDASAEAEPKEDEIKATKRSRPRSRTFTFTKSDKSRAEASPSKKRREQSKSRESKSRPTSIHIPKVSMIAKSPTTPTSTSPFGSLGRKTVKPDVPADYISYLKTHQDPVKVEVGRLHKLRILLRNETVAWVDSFLGLGGMGESVGLLHRTMQLEWREEHEDQLLHEVLLCLKGLCTTERAMEELEKVADELFPALLGMLFDEEKKGPAEYSTRTIIINVLFTFLSAATNSSAEVLEKRARRILGYLGEPEKAEGERLVDFVMEMRTPRPYRLWCREVTNVTKEVFWIFLHHLNVVTRPKTGAGRAGPSESLEDEIVSEEEKQKVLQATYTQRHFPGSRPPVPAAPYIGGVEWDATTYLTAHLDLLNGLLSSLPTSIARNDLRKELQASGFEKVMGSTLRTCKEKFYSGVHDGLRAWVSAAAEDGWETRFVREGPTEEERVEKALAARSASPKKSGKKAKGDEVPRLEAPPKLELDIG